MSQRTGKILSPIYRKDVVGQYCTADTMTTISSERLVQYLCARKHDTIHQKINLDGHRGDLVNNMWGGGAKSSMGIWNFNLRI
jgi:hypothetical protein